MKRRYLAHWKSAILSFSLFSLSLWAIYQELRQYSLAEVKQSLAQLSAHQLLWAIALMSLNYFVMTGYDTLAVRYVHRTLPYSKTALVAIATYGVSNSVGLALLSGSAIRYRFYRGWGLSVLEIAQISAFCNLTFWLGLFTVGSGVFLFSQITVPAQLHLPFISVRPVGIVFGAVILGYLLITNFWKTSVRLGSWTIPHLSLRLSLWQLTVGALDWTFAAATLYVLLPASASLSYPSFFSIYLLAQIAGVISNVPGGLGVFETVMLLLLSAFMPSATLFGALIAYRGIYYLLPLMVAFVILGGYEFKSRSQ